MNELVSEVKLFRGIFNDGFITLVTRIKFENIGYYVFGDGNNLYITKYIPGNSIITKYDILIRETCQTEGMSHILKDMEQITDQEVYERIAENRRKQIYDCICNIIFKSIPINKLATEYTSMVPNGPIAIYRAISIMSCVLLGIEIDGCECLKNQTSPFCGQMVYKTSKISFIPTDGSGTESTDALEADDSYALEVPGTLSIDFGVHSIIH